ncbi:MAG TPA: DUF167 domain-containing protein [Candidatus Hydrogenedentes bacterium]|nr:DUF167 domain-containing protein [Candidatus Hydrogenedentota bacterium]HIJ74628.1 DUF167 domain-containing protein [Candidatus Hydrogenedentota bacterium]
MATIEEQEGRVILRLRVQPRASRNAVTLARDGRLRVALTAAPAQGAANRALVRVLAKALGVPKAGVSLVRGEKARDKTLAVTGMRAGEVRRKLGIDTPGGPRKGKDGDGTKKTD